MTAPPPEEDRDFVRYGLTRVKYRDIFATKETPARDFVRVICKFQGEVTMEDEEAALFLEDLDRDTRIYYGGEPVVSGGKLAPPAPAEAEAEAAGEPTVKMSP